MFKPVLNTRWADPRVGWGGASIARLLYTMGSMFIFSICYSMVEFDYDLKNLLYIILKLSGNSTI
jgi:hypothetical protein